MRAGLLNSFFWRRLRFLRHHLLRVIVNQRNYSYLSSKSPTVPNEVLRSSDQSSHTSNWRVFLSHPLIDTILVEDCLRTGKRVVIPKKLQANVSKELHVGHPGIVRMKKFARRYVYWSNIDEDCESENRATDRNVKRYAKYSIEVPLETWPTPTRVWQRIHVDFAGSIYGCYYAVLADAFSKWPEKLEMKNISANQTVKGLGVVRKNGPPKTIVTMEPNSAQINSGKCARKEE
uniref:RNA-directed DNA polymerase n=1 Tax=Haemonchus placei TaxID=6290 RepID=A0A0N4X1N6_HAEPC